MPNVRPVENLKDATSIVEFSSYKRSRERAKNVLDSLWLQPDHELTDKSGRANGQLIQLTGSELTGGGMNNFLRQMEDAGFITRQMNGKRTYSIKLGKQPTDWSPPEPVVLEEGPPTNGDAVHVEEEELITPTEPTLEQEARDGGIRPGRLAARLEGMQRTIPALVEEGVVAGINGWFTQIAVALGYTQQAPDNEQVDELSHTLAGMEKQLEQLTEELRAERRSNYTAREEMNRVLRNTVPTRETSPVRPSELQEAYRGLASHAISNGWTLHRTGGGHVMWKAPTGERYFTASTSSDWRAVRNARSDMERMGLPKE